MFRISLTPPARLDMCRRGLRHYARMLQSWNLGLSGVSRRGRCESLMPSRGELTQRPLTGDAAGTESGTIQQNSNLTFNLTSRIYILTGAVQSGKTTALMRWAAERGRIGGFLSPDVEGLRRLYTLRDRQLRHFQAHEEEGDLVVVGKFRFYASAFELGRQTLLADSQAGLDWLVIDEIGKLELAGQGFEPAAGQVIRRFQEEEGKCRLLLVVRDYLLEEVVRRYGLGACEALDISDFGFAAP